MTTTSSPFNVSLGAGIRVLLIEENAEAASQIQKLLAERSKPTFSMEQVQTVDRALIRLAETGWHVILMDPMISGGSGIEQIRRLDDAASQIPIIVLGSDEDDAAALSAVELGAQDYLVKHRMDSFLLSRSIQYAIGRKHTEAALTQSEEKYHRIFESIVEGIFQTTPDGHYMSANPALARIYGYDSPEDLMSNITDISKALYVEPGRRDEFIRVMEKNDIVSGFESKIHRKDGSIIWISENVRAIRDKRFDNGVRWEWKFDCHKVGYGYNSFFLGIHPYPSGSLSISGINFDTRPGFKRSNVVSPTSNLQVGDGMPKSDGFWSSSLWWPTSCMDRRASSSQAFEGVDPIRHAGQGVAVFNDGHAESRKDKQINPPVDPGAGGARGLINSHYWDPLQRAGTGHTQ